MKPTLSVLDPLAAREVAIHITLPSSDEPRDGRPVLVSVGSAGQTPLFREGKLADVAELIRDGWAAFGARVELQAAPTATDTETAVIATADVGYANDANDTNEANDTNPDNKVAVLPKPPVKVRPMPPKPANLSLF
jgi:hypothetical protein